LKTFSYYKLGFQLYLMIIGYQAYIY